MVQAKCPILRADLDELVLRRVSSFMSFQASHPNIIPGIITFPTIMVDINRVADNWPKRKRRMINRRTLVMLIAMSSCATIARADTLAVPSEAGAVMNRYCVACHGEKKQKGKMRLDTLASLNGDARIDLLNKMQEAIRFKEMPPEDQKQPTDGERKLLDDWIASVLKPSGPSKLEDKLRLPAYDNRVDHDKLFSGEYRSLKGFTNNRRWLISEFIFNAKINHLIDHPGVRTIDDKRTTVTGDNGVNLGTRFGGGSLRQSITNPFLLPTNIGVRYYDNTLLTGGHLLTMISNAKKIAG